MAPAAFIGRYLVYRYLFDLPLNEDQRETAFFTVNKHWAPLVFHGCTPTVLVVSSIHFYCLMRCNAVNQVYENNKEKCGCDLIINGFLIVRLNRCRSNYLGSELMGRISLL
jgi:hypothetical protein